ncbi:transcription factor/nuclear export subunit protein 2-domain-containing protein [Lentinula aff. detonsa]|nr:transcription factor/nuclear export subunit protein 2-domain-containing protein [Lentinula aff. detonsa]
MDVVSEVRAFIDVWKSGGEGECRNMLIAPHCNPSECHDVLKTTYGTLISSTLLTWASQQAMSVEVLVMFINSVLDNLPSTSSSNTSSNVAIFGEYLVDLIWAVDAELDEILADRNVTIPSSSYDGQNPDKPPTINAKANKVKENAGADKATVVSIVKKLLDLGVLNPNICRERLDTAILEGTGLMVKANLDKKEVRTRTGLFYKQNKFNLLREQSEGYSKLTVELTSALGIGHLPSTGRPPEAYDSILNRARVVWGKFISLIGFFDLDPNKALDIILDVMSVNLASHYTFFIALLSFSPWAPLSPLRLGESFMPTDPEPDRFKGKTLDEIIELANPRPVSSSAGGSRVLAQILGFKFNYFQSTEAPETPKSLYLTAAILIREGFVALEDLYPHLSPNDSEMADIRSAHLKDVESRISAAKMSQLAMAMPLESNTSFSSMKTKVASVAETKKAVEAQNSPKQKIGVLLALLSVGAMKPAIAILSRFPWLVDSQPDIADLLIRIMKISISQLYDTLIDTKERNPDFTQPRLRYSGTGSSPPPSRKPVLSLVAPTPPSTSTVDYVFFFPDWNEQVPICNSLDDLIDVIEPFLGFIGLHISRDPLFLTKLVRLGRQQLLTTIPIDLITRKSVGEPDPENPIRQFWYRIIRQYLLPAISLIRGNAVCTVEVWNVVRLFDIKLRWKLYGEWRSETYKTHQELRIRRVQAERESKGILRRLSHKTIESLAGPVAKLAHSNPCILFTNAVNQIMAYDNLGSVVVQVLRSLTNMGFDVLTFVILDALANPNKQRVKDDGVNTSDWLQSIASFTGMLFRRYNASMSPILTYIVHQLQNGQTSEIVVLRELIWKMADIEPLPSLSDSQIQAMAGGPALRIEAIASSTRGARMDPAEGSRASLQRLGQGLIDTSLALPLLIQVAQQRQSSVFLARDAHIKSLAGLFDTTHGVLLQYLELLTTPLVLSPQDYATKVLPPLRELYEKYGICAPMCMQIIRPVLHAQLLDTALKMEEKQRLANEEAEKRLKAALTAKREPSVTQSRIASPTPNLSKELTSENKSLPDSPPTMEDVSMEADTSFTVSAAPESPWLPQLECLFEDVQKILPKPVYDVLGPGFYLTFWQLSTYDLSPPGSRYDEEMSALRSLSRQEDSKYIACDKSSDRSKRFLASSHRNRRDRFNSFATTLVEEYKEQTISRAFTVKRFVRERAHWFTTVINASQKQTQAHLLLDAFIEHCIHPRSLVSPMDADFCAQFIKVLHTQATPGFHTLACYDKILGDQIKVILFSCSEYEARNYGRFLLGVLSDLHKWHSEEQVYSQDNRSKIGGKTVLHPGFQSQYRLPMPPENHLKWSVFQKIVRKWHKKISLAFIDCIQTGEFMHVYNAIVVLKEILPFFPLSAVSQETGPQLDKVMDQFLEKEERGDLKILGRAYSASLKKREQLWTPTKAAIKPPATASPRPTGSSIDRPRVSAPPVGPSAQNASINDIKRSAPANSSIPTPSGPRAQLTSGNTASTLESLRPPVVKRVRPDTSNPASPAPPADKSFTAEPAAVSFTERKDELKDHAPSSTARIEQKDKVPQPTLRSTENSSHQVLPTMPPPSEPSQKPSAQELRVTAAQSRSDKSDDKNGRSPRGTNNSAAPSPRHRSVSPATRPGTRNHSTESRTSAGRSRSERDKAEPSVDKRDREHGPTRRDSLTHNRSDRNGRERTTTGDSDRDRDSRRDRHGDKEKDRGDRDRDRDRDREKDRDRHGDRHRRDDKIHTRDARKDRDGRTSENGNPPVVPDTRVPTRPEVRRRNSDDALGKRRRGNEDDPDRGPKRSSRKEIHREERSRRPVDKNDRDKSERPRDLDRRRRDVENSNSDNRADALDKVESKRPPEGPQSETKRTERIDAPLRSASKLPPNAPSAPRAMASTDARNSVKSDTGSGRRDGTSTGLSAAPLESAMGSLRSRIGDEKINSRSSSYHGQSRKDERDSRKRPFNDRERDSPDISNQGPEQSTSKRPKLNRNRYVGESANMAKKTLPINPQASDRLQGRKD